MRFRRYIFLFITFVIHQLFIQKLYCSCQKKLDTIILTLIRIIICTIGLNVKLLTIKH